MRKSRFLQIVSLFFSMLFMLSCVIGCNKTNVEEPEPISYRLNKTAVILNVGESVELEVLPQPEETLIWASNDTAIAIVEDGVVYAMATGMATIDVQVGEKVLSCVVSVQNNIEINKSIRLDTTEIYLAKGSLYRLTATLTENGQEISEKINWEIISGSVDDIQFSPIGYGKQCEILAKEEGVFIIQATDVSGSVGAVCKLKVVTEHFNRLQSPKNFQSTGEVITWDPVERAEGYIYSLDGQEEQFAASNSINIKEYLQKNKVAILTVRAKGNELATVDSYQVTTIVYAQLHLFKANETQCAWYKVTDAESYVVCNEKGANIETLDADAFSGTLMYYNVKNQVDYSAITVKALDANGDLLNESEQYQHFYNVLSCDSADDVLDKLTARYAYGTAVLETGYKKNVVVGDKAGDFAYYTSQRVESGKQAEAMAFNVKMQYTKEQLIALKLLGFSTIAIPVYVDYEGAPIFDENGAVVGETFYDINKNHEHAYFNNLNIGMSDKIGVKFKTWDVVEIDLQTYIDNYDEITSNKYYLLMNYHYANENGSVFYNPIKMTVYFEDIYIK